MAMRWKQKRFKLSKCDRCGQTTRAKQNGIGDLYVLPHEWPEPLSDLGSFCLRCIEGHSVEDWLAWYREHEERYWVSRP